MPAKHKWLNWTNMLQDMLEQLKEGYPIPTKDDTKRILEALTNIPNGLHSNLLLIQAKQHVRQGNVSPKSAEKLVEKPAYPQRLITSSIASINPQKSYLQMSYGYPNVKTRKIGKYVASNIDPMAT